MLFLYVFLAVCLLAGTFFLWLFFFVNDTGVKTEGTNKNFTRPKTLLAVFAHPDDEIVCLGTLCKWRQLGTKIHLAYLTHGEAGPTGGLVERQNLGAQRAKELAEIAKIIGAKTLDIFAFPDGGLPSIEKETIKASIQQLVNKHKPDALLCFDDTIGLYGHKDHRFSGECAQQVALQNKSVVKQVFIMTLPVCMINLAMKISSTFRNNYNSKNGMPKASLAVKIRHFAKSKKAGCLAHKTQWQVVNDVQPMVSKTPYWLYYRVFSREYFKHINQ